MTPRSRLYLIALLVAIALSLVGGPYLNKQLHRSYESHLRLELQSKARMVALALHSSPHLLDDTQKLDALIDHYGREAGARISLIGPQGQVRADSAVGDEELYSLPSQGTRPEILGAHERGMGWDRRYDRNWGADTVYVAVGGAPQDNYVRLAVTTETMNKTLSGLRLMMLAAAGLGLLLASAVGALASHFATQTLRSLVESARAMGKRGGGRVPYTAGDELGVLAGSLNHLAEELETNVERLGQERDRMETILRGTSEGILALDADRRIRLVNTAATGLLELSDSVEGKPIYEVSREPDLLLLAEQGLKETKTMEITTGDSTRTLLVRADPLQATGGTVLVLHDVTEMRRLEAIRRDFVANVSHELRTPVSIIRANSETLIDGGALDHPKARETFVKAIGRNAERLEQLISDLLDLARVESGKQELHPRELSVLTEVERVFSLLHRKAEAKSLELTVQVDATLRLVADAKALDQILVNLVDNAVKYSDRPGKIWLVAVEELEYVRICVDDEGPGIPEQSRARIFERFYRVDAGRSRELGGTGLGLSIVKHLTQVMGGMVGVEPRHPRGTRFWIRLKKCGAALEV